MLWTNALYKVYSFYSRISASEMGPSQQVVVCNPLCVVAWAVWLIWWEACGGPNPCELIDFESFWNVFLV